MAHIPSEPAAPEAWVQKRSFEKKSRHEALADVYESIAELQHYRTHWLAARAP